MKKLLFTFLAAGIGFQALAQTELKLSPIPLLFGYVALSVEQQINPSFGIDGDLLLLDGAFGANISGKYYFDPELGIDKFHIGGFLGAYQDAGLGIGFLAGYKWVSRKNVVFELGLGVGRGFDLDVIGYGKLHVGYRFNKKSAAPK
ncbi:MAG: hypothetical protein JNJ57_09075 [Saprospiraceae bacterium]|nr:hypothetical protein [Saprospiraceae bacterium]